MPNENQTRAYLIAVRERTVAAQDADEELEEFVSLASGVGLTVVGQTVQRVQRFSHKYYMGTGLAESLKATLEVLDAGLLLVDGELSAVQERNLAKVTGATVYTRTDVILDIFASRAGTREGKLQVELAQLEYALPRMVGMWTHFGRISGGIQGRGGAGETQLEIDRRRARSRIARLRRELEDVRRVRAEHRKQRSKREIPVFALVGYTNAGKSSLLNRLTDGGAVAANRLFSTLDPLTEQLILPNRQQVLVTDTVGFIRRLPHTLVDAFRATLEEVQLADVLLHVVDGADPEADTKAATVREVLEQIGAADRPVILVVNKADRMPEGLAAAGLRDAELEAVPVSALTGAGIDDLLIAMERAVSARLRRLKMHIPYAEGKALADILANGEVFSRRDADEGIDLVVALNQILAGRYRAFVLPDRVRKVAS